MTSEVICQYCNKPARWVDNAEIYNGKRFGKSYMMWWCKPCDAYVGCHNNTKEPLGSLSNRELRFWRRKAHATIDPFWKSKQLKRQFVYTRLNVHFGCVVHVGWSDVEMCKKIVEDAPALLSLSKEEFKNKYPKPEKETQ